MKKGHYTIIILAVGLVLFGGLLSIKDNRKRKIVVYNGNNLLINIDGQVSTDLPASGNYYLVNYSCDSNNTKVSWNHKSYDLEVSNGKDGGSIYCNLTFKSNPLLREMPVGSYVDYTGTGGAVGSSNVSCQIGGAASNSNENLDTESPNSCKGQNAREDLDNSGYTYGYCTSDAYKYVTTGWRLAYVDGNKPVIISAGSPECNSRTSSTNNVDYMRLANTRALKYCNNEYVEGDCSCLDSDGEGLCDSPSTDAWAINENDFHLMIEQNIGKSNSYLYSHFSNDDIACGTSLSSEECGYNNDLFDNGGYYWFDGFSINNKGVYWIPSQRKIGETDSNESMGLRPMISLKKTIVVIGGSGTKEEPYLIGNNYFTINNDEVDYINNDMKSEVNLKLNYIDGVSKMCISVDEVNCSNYINFRTNHTLDFTNESDGVKTIYVYYKNASGLIIDSMSKSITLDTTGPTNSSVTFNEDDGYKRTLTISSEGAMYMCFSNDSSQSSNCTEWIDYATSYEWELLDGVGEKTLYGFFKDAAGNISNVSIATTCTNDCFKIKYFLGKNSASLYLVRNDGATSNITTSSTSITWYTEGSQQMYYCDTYNNTTTVDKATIWCLGQDGNAYYKISPKATTWTKVDISSYIDFENYTYTLTAASADGYIIRSDGKRTKITTAGGLEDTTWNIGQDQQLAVCTIYSAKVACLDKSGAFLYRNSYKAPNLVSRGSLGGEVTNVNLSNTWIEIGNSNTNVYLMQTDDEKIYTITFSFPSGSASWKTASIPESGIVTCGVGGGWTCLGQNGYLYTLESSTGVWTKSSLMLPVE